MLLVISSYASGLSWCHVVNTNVFLPVLQSSPVCCPRTWYPKTTSRSDTWSPSLPPPGSASTIWKAVSESRLMRMQKWQTRSCMWKDCGRWSATRTSVCDRRRRHTSAQDAGWLELCGHVKKKYIYKKEISHRWNSFTKPLFFLNFSGYLLQPDPPPTNKRKRIVWYSFWLY